MKQSKSSIIFNTMVHQLKKQNEHIEEYRKIVELQNSRIDTLKETISILDNTNKTLKATIEMLEKNEKKIKKIKKGFFENFFNL